MWLPRDFTNVPVLNAMFAIHQVTPQAWVLQQAFVGSSPALPKVVETGKPMSPLLSTLAAPQDIA